MVHRWWPTEVSGHEQLFWKHGWSLELVCCPGFPCSLYSVQPALFKQQGLFEDVFLVFEEVFVSFQDFPFPISEFSCYVFVSSSSHHLGVEIVCGVVQDGVSAVPHIPQYLTELFVEHNSPAAT